jgi:hypothetical protein
MIICWKRVNLSKEKFFSSVLSSHGQYEYFVPVEGQPETPGLQIFNKGWLKGL